MVLNVVNRTVSGPLDIKCDQSDIMMALNTGWIIIMAHTTQMVYDFNILALKIAERAKLPIIVSSDGFFTSHQKKKVQLFKNDSDVQNFLGKYACSVEYSSSSRGSSKTYSRSSMLSVSWYHTYFMSSVSLHFV